MIKEVQREIAIPSDNDGYALLQCNHCGTHFKITTSDLENDEILHIFCPSCGLISENYISDDVMALAEAITKNLAMDIMYDEFKKMERNLKYSPLKFKVGRKPEHKLEDPIHAKIEALETTDFLCCKRNAKIKPLLRMTGCYCPFCGVKNFEFE